jgi:hypothetical protein
VNDIQDMQYEYIEKLKAENKRLMDVIQRAWNANHCYETRNILSDGLSFDPDGYGSKSTEGMEVSDD